MEKRQLLWKTKGMNKDLSVSAFNPEFAFENMNLRLSTNEHNTLMSWVNERGTEKIYLKNGKEFWVKDSAIVFEEPSPSTGWTHYAVGDDINIIGTPIGTAVIDHQLVLFTHGTNVDYIYTIHKEEIESGGSTTIKMFLTLLYSGNLNFDNDSPLETLVSYEMDTVEKVYWVDGRNQPRVINIKGDIKQGVDTQFDFVPELALNETVTVDKLYGGGRFAPGVIQYSFTYVNKYGQESNIFYTTPLYYISFADRAGSPEEMIDNAFDITVTRLDLHFDYLRIYSIQRTSLNKEPIVKRLQDVDIHNLNPNDGVTTLNTKETSSVSGVNLNNPEWEISNPVQGPLSSIAGYHPDVSWMGYKKANNENLVIQVSDGYITWGAASTEDSCIWVSSEVSNKRCICGTTDENGDLDTCSLQDFKFRSVPFGDTVLYTDTGLTGDTVDPTELLYKGGNVLIPYAIGQKDNTLFFGNLQLEETYIGGIEVSSNPTKYLKEDIRATTISCSTRPLNTKLISSGSYTYYNQLNNKDCAGFKKNNYYRLGVQFQYKTGKWSEPLFIKDAQQTGHFTTQGNILNIPVFTGSLSQSAGSALLNEGYKKARAVVVYPNQNDRVVICQGVAAPTLYTDEHRDNNADLYAQSSWFFRTLIPSNLDYSVVPLPPTYGINSIEYTDRSIIGQGTSYDPSHIKGVEIQGDYNSRNKFKIDWQFFTLHSPETEFDTSMYATDFSSANCYKVGTIQFDHTLSDIDIQTESPTISNLGSGFDHKSFDAPNSAGIASGLFYDDYIVDDMTDYSLDRYTDQKRSVRWMVYLWNKTGSLNNDINRPSGKGVASAILKKKKVSNLRIATTNLIGNTKKSLEGFPQLFSSDQISIVKVNEKIYQGNIDTVLTPDNADGMYFAYGGTGTNPGKVTETDFTTSFEAPIRWKSFDDISDANQPGIWFRGQNGWEKTSDPALGDHYTDLCMKKEFVRMKYKSTPHIVFKLNTQEFLVESGDGDYHLPIVELQRDVNVLTIFGGQSEDALKANTWIPCGEPVTLNSNGTTTIEFSYGDTYYQRYDCLKTYAFTPEDENQVVEIGSFMLETYTNIEGRYDRNRGQKSNVNMSPQNFNLLNPVYSQQNNFFTYKIVSDKDSTFTYPNQITYSLTKTSGADVDAWTNMSLGSILELDGDKGSVTKLAKLDDKLIAFQDSGISQILYNESVQVESTAGAPIEIANSGKVQGARYISGTVGCSNKWSIAQTPSGLYFMDSNDKSIYLLGDGLKNITQIGGFNTWAKNNISTYKEEDGEPLSAGAFKAFYDRLNQEVLFINQEKALAWSERIGAFTSFYNYGNAPYFINLDDEGYWLNTEQNSNSNSTDYKLWKHQGGNYCEFFGINKEYYTTLIGNAQPQADKIFTNLEFRACVDRMSGEQDDNQNLPFDSIKAWNEYQSGITTLKSRNAYSPHRHYEGGYSALLRKFRIWRCDIPRDNDTTGNRTARPMDRMRNPWLYLKLVKEAATTGSTLSRAEIHDVVMDYFV